VTLLSASENCMARSKGMMKYAAAPNNATRASQCTRTPPGMVFVSSAELVHEIVALEDLAKLAKPSRRPSTQEGVQHDRDEQDHDHGEAEGVANMLSGRIERCRSKWSVSVSE